MKFPKFAALAAVSLFLGSTAQAITYNLYSSMASTVGGNLTSSFYDVNGNGNEVNGTTAKNWFSPTVGGNQEGGFWVRIAFGTNPQPMLTSAFLKASNSHLLWDAADLAAFNGGSFDSITLWNAGANGLKNPNGKFQGTSHAGVNGSGGVRIPDGGATVALLGTALVLLGLARRRPKTEFRHAFSTR